MIDPKLNKVPVNPADKAKGVQASEPRQSASPGARRTSEGLSINDTIAGDHSPAPTIVPPGRGSGMTPRSTSALTQDTSPNLLERSTATSVSQEEVSARAYRCWQERGCPEGSPEVDWRRAEKELNRERKTGWASAAGV